MSEPAPVRSRRGILLLAAAAGTAGVAACSIKPMPSNVPLSRQTPGAANDVELLVGLLALERYAVAAYAAGRPLLHGAGAQAAKQFLGQDLAHAAELEGLITQSGGKPPKPPAFYDLGQPRDQRQVLELLHATERAQIRGYLHAVSRLSPPRLRAAIAAILANDAQHAAVVRAQLGLEAVPAALVSGGE